MRFNQIVAVDAVNLTEEAILEIKEYSKESAKFYDSDPKNTNETIGRIGGADCVLISWRTKFGKEVFEKCKI